MSEDKPKNERKGEMAELKEDVKKSPDLLALAVMLFEKYPDQMGHILQGIAYSIGGNPDQIKAETKISLRVSTIFFILMGLIITLAAFLAFSHIVSGDAL